ncbi:hypothetical protein NJC38_02685 [Pseudomonas sp. 21LCFQ010]|uniref:hypothetical protein n=1 Tax=Pseudomonas sp. 21LCFQ010 TaxID=2957506 RepID=UPI002096DC05|nr:hypothetical protein [Pseudomonas sp. 21LCFQ010]MCO8161057.1 hypothetical protein [Pseudomonas sp. 21LCFQ010]
MKSEYRSLVEAIICDELKLAEISKIHAEAQEAAAKAAETLSVVEKRLEAKRGELGRLEGLLQNCHRASGDGKSLGSNSTPADQAIAADSLLKDIKEMRATLKFLCDHFIKGS